MFGNLTLITTVSAEQRTHSERTDVVNSDPWQVTWVALAFVISFGVVPAGSLVLTFRGAKHQHQHEAASAFEEKALGETSETLYNVIGGSRSLADAMLTTDPRS